MTGRNGQAAITGATARTQLGLRSTGFRVGALDVVALAEPAGFGKRVRIRGVARNVRGAALEELIDGAWTRVHTLKPGASGDFNVRYRPHARTVLRLVAQGDLQEPGTGSADSRRGRSPRLARAQAPAACSPASPDRSSREPR